MMDGDGRLSKLCQIFCVDTLFAISLDGKIVSRSDCPTQANLLDGAFANPTARLTF